VLAAVEIIGGLALLFLGGEILVQGSVALARRFNIPTVIIGLTIVAIGTSAPEILVSIQAALNDHPDIAIGNVVGSNISNILLVLGVTAIVAPVVVHKTVIARDAPILLAITILFSAFCWTSKEITSVEAIILLSCLVAYAIYTIKTAKNHIEADEITEELPEDITNIKTALYIIGGIGALAFGADILVSGASEVARLWGISEAVIGLTIVAIGSSTPELTTCVLSAKRGHADLAAGNVVGSNLINILAGMGIPALIIPLPIAASFFKLDIWVMLAATILMILTMKIAKKFTKTAGIVLFISYISYITALFLGSNA
jgi:cation:H+ antiporter